MPRGSHIFLTHTDDASKFCRIIGSDYENIRIYEDKHEIILLNLCDDINEDFLNSTIILTENTDDAKFYNLMGRYYIKKKGFGNIGIYFEEQNGGGSTITNVYRKIISRKDRFCICIVDSDKKYGKSSCGETMKKIQSMLPLEKYYETVCLDVHEIENLIPVSILEGIVNQHKLEKKGLLFYKYLLKCDKSEESPIFYFDMKKGILKSSFILDEDANEERKKIFNKKELYRNYWKGYIEGFGIKIDEESNEKLVDGICENILAYAIEYLQEMIQSDKTNILKVETPVLQKWEYLGEKIYCCGCVGGRIAV